MSEHRPGGEARRAPAEGPAAPAFRGYNPVRYTPCPDEFFDQQMAEMDEDELRVTLYAFRRTFGFKKTDDAISISQFLHGITTRDGRRLDRGCGLKTPRQVLAGLAKAERRRTLLSAFFCRACGGCVPEETMLDEERCQRLVNGERHCYSVRVVPRLCPACGARLRGFEEKRYLLNVLEGTGPAVPPSAASPSVPATVPPDAPLPSVNGTVPSYPGGRGRSARQTETRNTVQQTAEQGMADRSTVGGDVDLETTSTTGADGAPLVPVFVPPGSVLPSPQLWVAALTQAGPSLERNDQEGWLRASALLAARREAGGSLNLVVGVPTEHARWRCLTRATMALEGAFTLLLGQPVTIEPVVTGVWLAEQRRRQAGGR